MRQSIYAILAGILFGVSTPFAKVLLGDVSPVSLAGLLYLGSGLGLIAAYFVWARQPSGGDFVLSDVPWLSGAVLFGGVLAPVLLMAGLTSVPASSASLLLNLEGVFTALVAWVAFGEHLSARSLWGMALMVGGGVLLSGPEGVGVGSSVGFLAIAAACLCWAIDNNLTQKAYSSNPVLIAAIKGMVAGCVNFSLGMAIGHVIPPLWAITGSLVLGFLGYGMSLTLFVVSLRHIGTARTGAYFSLAPFIGAAVSIPLLGEQVSVAFLVVALLMGVGVWFLLSEHHDHEHVHEAQYHSHAHSHDSHHDHEHESPVTEGIRHTHRHRHVFAGHGHAHYPDIHHRHRHP